MIWGGGREGQQKGFIAIIDSGLDGPRPRGPLTVRAAAHMTQERMPSPSKHHAPWTVILWGLSLPAIEGLAGLDSLTPYYPGCGTHAMQAGQRELEPNVVLTQITEITELERFSNTNRGGLWDYKHRHTRDRVHWLRRGCVWVETTVSLAGAGGPMTR